MSREIIDGMEIMPISECEQRLELGGIGMLALCGVAAPVLRPVNFGLAEGAIVIRTGEGQILEAASGNEPASFMISEIDRFEHTGWSVVVTGKLSAVSPSSPATEARVRPWIRAEKQNFVKLEVDTISGRRIPTEGQLG